MNMMKSVRKAIGLSRKQMAQQLGVSCSLITMIENGERRITEAMELKLKNIIDEMGADTFEKVRAIQSKYEKNVKS